MAVYRSVLKVDAWLEFQKNLSPKTPLPKASLVNGCMEDILRELTLQTFEPLPRPASSSSLTTTSTCDIWKVVEANRKKFCHAIQQSMQKMTRRSDRVVCIAGNSEIRAKFKHFLQQYIQQPSLPAEQLLRAQLFLSILECISS